MTINIHAVKLLLGVLTLFVSSYGNAQTLDERVVLVRDVYRQLNDAIDRGNTYLLDARSEVVRSSGNRLDTFRSRLSAQADSHCSRLVSGETELLQDGEVSVLIVPGNKTILIRNAAEGSRVQEAAHGIATIRDTLFALAHVRSCDTLLEGGRQVQHVSLEFGSGMNVPGNLRHATFAIDIDARKLRRVKMSFSGGAVLSMDVAIDLLEFNSTVKPLAGSALARIWTADNHLLPEYHGFTVLDRRTGSRKGNR